MQVLEGPQFTGAAGTPASGGWDQAGWQSYNRALGETLPSCGDLDGDGRDELLIGVDERKLSAGKLYIVLSYMNKNSCIKAFIPQRPGSVRFHGYNRSSSPYSNPAG